MIPRTNLPDGETVPVLGQGTWMLAGDRARRAEEVAALRRGLDATAHALHGRGRLERYRAAVHAAGRTIDGRAQGFLRGMHGELTDACRALERAPERVRAGRCSRNAARTVAASAAR